MATAGFQTFTSSTTWVCPPGIKFVLVTGCGGGGGGHFNGGAGGGAATLQQAIVEVTPGTSYTIIIGSGGLGTVSGTAQPGGSTMLGSLIKFMGGGAATSIGPGANNTVMRPTGSNGWYDTPGGGGFGAAGKQNYIDIASGGLASGSYGGGGAGPYGPGGAANVAALSGSGAGGGAGADGGSGQLTLVWYPKAAYLIVTSSASIMIPGTGMQPVLLWGYGGGGAGGGGAGGGSDWAGAGGGGSVASAYWLLITGSTRYEITAGVGGWSTSSSGRGNDGQPSNFHHLVQWEPGAGGSGGRNVTAQQGTGEPLCAWFGPDNRSYPSTVDNGADPRTLNMDVQIYPGFGGPGRSRYNNGAGFAGEANFQWPDGGGPGGAGSGFRGGGGGGAGPGGPGGAGNSQNAASGSGGGGGGGASGSTIGGIGGSGKVVVVWWP